MGAARRLLPDSFELLRMAAGMRRRGEIPPQLALAAAENPLLDSAARLERKVQLQGFRALVPRALGGLGRAPGTYGAPGGCWRYDARCVPSHVLGSHSAAEAGTCLQLDCVSGEPCGPGAETLGFHF